MSFRLLPLRRSHRVAIETADAAPPGAAQTHARAMHQLSQWDPGSLETIKAELRTIRFVPSQPQVENVRGTASVRWPLHAMNHVGNDAEGLAFNLALQLIRAAAREHIERDLPVSSWTSSQAGDRAHLGPYLRDTMAGMETLKAAERIWRRATAPHGISVVVICEDMLLSLQNCLAFLRDPVRSIHLTDAGRTVVAEMAKQAQEIEGHLAPYRSSRGR